MELIKCEVCNKEFNSQEALEMHNSAKHNIPQKREKFKTKKKNKILLIGILAVLIVVSFYGYRNITENVIEVDGYDEFAKYLTEQGVKMYGTEWCPHCKNQKKLFGSSFQYINYTDCDKNRQECLSAGVQGYPTWEIDGQNYPGEQSLERLAQLSGYTGSLQ